MSIYITESFTIELPDVFEQLETLNEAETDQKLIIELAAIHEGLTGNYNFYPAKVLEAAMQSWVNPYPKPILINHDVKNANPLGRVMAAKMDKDENNVPFIRLQVGITDAAAVQKIRDKRYLTGSVGATASSANCSICNVELAEQMCRHVRGKVYNGKLAYRKVNDLKFHEYSFVNVPGDSKSIILSTSDKIDESAAEDSEWIYPARIFALDMNNQRVVEFTESMEPVNILESMTKKNAHVTYNNIKGTWLSVTAHDYIEEDAEELTNKNNENVTHSVIDNTMNMEESSMDDDKSKLETEKVNVEEKKMPEDVLEAEEDLLDVVEQLSNDLASNAADEVVDESETTDSEDKVEENEDAMVEESTDETDESGELASDESEGDSVEGEPETIDEGTEDKEEQLAEAHSDEQAELDSTTTEEANVDVDVLVNENETLKEENKKLKSIVHRMLAERVVDKKIDCGLIESTERTDAIEEHVGRSASSLADSLKDLHRMPVIKRSEAVTEDFEMDTKLVSTETSDLVTESGQTSAPKVDRKAKEQKIIETFSDRLLNKSKRF